MAGITQERLAIANGNYSILTNLLLVQAMNVHNWFTWVNPAWSISVEWWVYMIFPFMAIGFYRLGAKANPVIVLLCFLGYLCITFYLVPLVAFPKQLEFIRSKMGKYTINVTYQFGFLRCLFGFVLGMVAYKAYRAGWAKRALANGYALTLFALAGFACMHFDLPDAISVSFFPLVLLCAAYGSKNINRVFAGRALQTLGNLSFALYLLHEPLLDEAVSLTTGWHFGGANGVLEQPPLLVGWLFCVVFAILMLAFASLMNRYIEVPARRWLNPQKQNSGA